MAKPNKNRQTLLNINQLIYGKGKRSYSQTILSLRAYSYSSDCVKCMKYLIREIVLLFQMMKIRDVQNSF